MTDTLTELKRLHAEATQGEWQALHTATGRGLDWIVSLRLKPLARILRLPQRDKALEACKAEEAANAALIVAAVNALPHLLACAEALEKCEAQFRFYADNHRAKGTPDGDEKAKTNDHMANIAAAALASLKGGA